MDKRPWNNPGSLFGNNDAKPNQERSQTSKSPLSNNSSGVERLFCVVCKKKTPHLISTGECCWHVEEKQNE